jgi:lysyl-tRNA synthetase class 2
MNWRPSATLKQIKERAKLLTTIRLFFDERNVMEVETALLSQATITDPQLFPFKTTFVDPSSPAPKTLYLQTSPEYAMKRLLCADSGDIYQMCKAFRNEESGRYHNPEFSILEWYRVGFDHYDLMHEVDELLQITLGTTEAERRTYQQVFVQYLDIDPLSADLESLKQVAISHGFDNIACEETNPDILLQLLFSHCVEPHIGLEKPVFIYHFPASQAALARISNEDKRVAERFEVYFKGIELANGFHELSDAREQRQRFENERTDINSLKQPLRAIDEHLLAALEHGLPDCAGVALGIDRLLMLKSKQDSIKDVLTMNISNA